MQKDRWQIIEKIFNQALELPLDARQEFIRRQYGNDEKLCGEIVRLIESDSRENCLLDKSVFALAIWLLSE